MGRQGIPVPAKALSLIVAVLLVAAIVSGAIVIGAPRFAPAQSPSARTAPATPAAAAMAKSPPDSVSPVVGPAGTTFHFTFAGLPPAAAYRTSYARGAVVISHASGDVPATGVLQLDLPTQPETFPRDTYFFTTRAGDAVRTVSFRVGG